MPKVHGSLGLARFKDFELDLQAGELRQKDDKIVRLPEQPFQILLTLLQHPGEIVSREGDPQETLAQRHRRGI